MGDSAAAVDAVFRAKYGELCASLLRAFGYRHFELVEEALQSARSSARSSGGLQTASLTIRRGGSTRWLATRVSQPCGMPRSIAVARSTFAFRAFNLTWIGLVVTAIAVRLNWRNSQRPVTG
jgi:hypothetical protein